MSQEKPPRSGDHRRRPGLASLNEGIRKAVQSHHHEEIVRLSTEAISLNPRNPKYYINRAVANNLLQNYREAITDAANALLLDSNHRLVQGRPYLQMGRALIGLAKFDQGFTIISEGIKIDSTDIRLEQCLDLARVEGTSKRATLGISRVTEKIGDTFDGGEMWLKLEADVLTSGYRHDLEFRRKMSEARKDNVKLGKHLREDKRFLKALEVLVNVKFSENIGRAEMERQGVEGNEEGNAEPFLERMSSPMILMVAEYALPDIEKLSQMLERQNEEVEKMADEQQDEAAEELMVELLKLASEGGNPVEEETGEK